MKFNMVVKGLFIALPLVLVGCSSSSNNMDDELDGTTITSSTDSSSSGGNSALAAEINRLQQDNTVYFDFDKYDIKSSFISTLDEHAQFLRSNNTVSVTIEGHADERGTPEYNIALGERRANAVKAYLQGRGVSANQLSIVSYGKEKPAVLGHSESAYAKNRRAIIVY